MKNKRKKIIHSAGLIMVITAVLIIIFNIKNAVYTIEAIDYEHVALDQMLRDASLAAEDIGDKGEGETDEKDDLLDELIDKKVILIDPGHGGDDPGCNYDGILESVINLEISLMLRDKLEELGYEVIMTREEDTRLTLNARSSLIKSYNPDLFISIHQNSLDGDTVTHGAETLYNDAFNQDSIIFAQYIQDALVKETGVKDRGIKLRSNLAVLKSISCPGCIVETGFLSSTTERLLLSSKEYQELIVEGIIKGIKEFLERGI